MCNLPCREAARTRLTSRRKPSIFAVPLVSQPGRFPLRGIQIPQGDGVARPMRRLHLVRIPPVRPEEQNPVEEGLDVSDPVVAPFREDSQETATGPHVPVEIEIVDGGNAATVLVGIVHVFDVVRPVTRIACDHCLCPLSDVVAPQLAVVHHSFTICDYGIDPIDQVSNVVTARFASTDPHDLVAPDVSHILATPIGNKLTILEHSGRVHAGDLMQHLQPPILPQEAIQHAHPVLIHVTDQTFARFL